MANERHPAEWLAMGSYGVMTHYLVSPEGQTEAEKSERLNAIVDNFDLDYFIGQFVASGADWLIFTIGQNTDYYNSPNAFLDRVFPGHTSRRDLVTEIAQRVKSLGKRFIAYLPVETAGPSQNIKDAFAWGEDGGGRPFLDRYLQFLRDYSIKLGKLADGWWFDGCYDHIHKGEWDWSEWVDAAQAGNPDSIIAFNDGAFCVGRLKPVSPLQHYHAGEVHLLEDGKIRLDFLSGDIETTADGKLRKPGQTDVPLYMPDSQFIDNVQWQALVPLDSTFNPDVPVMSYPDEELFRFVKECKAVGGAVTLNVPIDISNGHIPQKSAQQLERLGKAIICTN